MGYLGSAAQGAGRIEWWVFSEAQSAIYPLISPNLGKLGTDPSARDGMRDGLERPRTREPTTLHGAVTRNGQDTRVRGR